MSAIVDEHLDETIESSTLTQKKFGEFIDNLIPKRVFPKYFWMGGKKYMNDGNKVIQLEIGDH